MVVLPGGKVGFAEIKRPGGKTRKLQDKQIAFLQKLDFEAGVIDSVDKIEPFIQAVSEHKQVGGEYETNI